MGNPIDFAGAFGGGGGYSFAADDTTRQDLSAAVSSGNINFNKNKTSPLVYVLIGLGMILWYKSRKGR